MDGRNTISISKIQIERVNLGSKFESWYYVKSCLLLLPGITVYRWLLLTTELHDGATKIYISGATLE